jgi:hypothetical protein
MKETEYEINNAIDYALERGRLLERMRILNLLYVVGKKDYEPCEHTPKGYRLPCGMCGVNLSVNQVKDLILEGTTYIDDSELEDA